MADPLSSLRERLITAPQPIILSAAFIQSGGAVPPPGFDDELRAAFRLGAAGGLKITFAATDVGPIAGGEFTIKKAQLSFLGYPSTKSEVTIRFRQRTELEVVIEAVLADWTFHTTFPEMTGWPFDELSYTKPTFVFATDATDWGWSGGATVNVERGQNFVGTLGVPAVFQPTFDLVKGLGVVPPTLTAHGPIVVDKVTFVDPPDPPPPPEEPVVLYPDLDLRAEITAAPVEVFFLKAREPAVGLLIGGSDAVVAGTTVYEQTASLLFTSELEIDHTVTLDLRSRLSPHGNNFIFALVVDPDSPAQLTPASAIALLTGGKASESFLPGIPSSLQQFLASLELGGLTLRGSLPPSPELSSAGITIRTAKAAQPLVLFEDPTSREAFTIDSFDVSWTIQFGGEETRNLVSVGASFHLWKSVFPDAFRVEIDQDMRIDGEYDGSVSFAALLDAVTAGAIKLPVGSNDPTLSAFAVHIDPPARSYSLSCTVDATFDFVKLGDRPLLKLEDMDLYLAATTPADTGKTTYRAGIRGAMEVGELALDVAVEYDGTATPATWQFDGSLARPVHLSEIIGKFFQAYDLPVFLPGSIDIESFAIDATVPVGAQAKASYQIDGALSWALPLADIGDITVGAQIGLQYDAERTAGQEFSGSVIGSVELESFDTEVQVGYRFGPAAQDALDLRSPALALPLTNGDSKVLWVAWEGIRGEYDITQRTLSLSLAGWSAGRVITTLVRTVGDPYFELESPWTFLNQVSLDGLKLIFDFKTKQLNAEYTLSKPIELGFLRIDALYFKREAGKVKIAIKGSTTIKSLEGPLFDPKEGQDVRNLPQVPGQGNQYFELKLLMLGQRVGIVVDPSKFKTTEEVIKALEKVPSTTGDENPINPTDGDALQPYYDPQRGWLVAAHFLVLGETFDCQVVFNDPDLYGLRLAFAGEKAKVLDGLVIDVLYKKVTDDVGVYAVLFVFPKSLRNLDLGGVTITLPTIGVQIYTNGDFLFDFGFPYNLDFSRSFGLQAVIAGVPVLGAAGLYFGRLSVGAAAQLPQSTPGRTLVGSFSTATAFGLGLQLGVGKYFEKGPLKAGFSITVFGIVEGIIAPWHPPGGAELVPAAPGGNLQSDYYFRLQGTFGLIGKLYGSVDFAVVKADVSLTVTLSVRITYEAYADIVMSASASVSVQVSIEIDLGIFSFTLSFSFAATVTADVSIPSPQHDPPWYAKPLAEPRTAVAALPAPGTPPLAKTVLGADELPTLYLHPAPQYTVLSSDGTTLAAEEGAFVFLVATDAPTADGSGNRNGSSFESLCKAYFPWLIDAHVNGEGTHVDLDAVASTTVSKQQLQDLVSRLAKHPIPEAEIETKFLQPSFTVILEPAKAPERQKALQDGATLFPAFSGLTLTVPNRSGTGTVQIAFRDYVKITSGYRDRLNRYFAEVAARVEEESGGQAARLVGADDDPEPMAEFLFEDWFSLVGRQLLQAGADAIADFACPLEAGDSIQEVVSWSNVRGNTIGPLDVAAPNATFSLQSGRLLRIAGATYTVQLDDSLGAIADRYTDPSKEEPRWKLRPEDFVVANADVKGLVAAGIKVSYGEQEATTGPGESFAELAKALGTDPRRLGADAALQQRTDLLAPSTATTIPPFDYRTANETTDTLQAIVQRFDVPLEALLADEHNLTEPLFARQAGGARLRVAGLNSLRVSEVWDAICLTDEIAQIAGMVARYQLHGMRLPTDTGLELPSGFVYPSGLPEYGLYQLTGQQFPTPELTGTGTYSITMGKDASLSWLQLPDPTVDLTEPARKLYYLLQYARANPFAPSNLAIAPEPGVLVEPKRYAVQSSTPWATSDEARLLAVTSPHLAQDTGGPQVTPILWNLPDSLLRQVTSRQEALSRSKLGVKEALPYMPAVQPQLGISDPATGRTSFSALDRYALATRVQIEVKRLAQTDDLAPQRPDANDVVPPSPGNSGAPSPLAPFNYELVGVGPADALLLERLLVAMNSLGEDMVSQLFLLYQTTEPGSPGLTSRADAEFLSFITQTNLSTETNPPAGRLAAAVGREPPRGIANSPAEFLKLLWELSTVRSGGYYLYYQLLKGNTGLPDTLFDSSGTATLTLVAALDRDLSPPNALRLLDCANAFVTTDSVDTARSVMTLQSQSSEGSRKLTGIETLAGISATFGTDVGELASLNATVPFATGAEIPVSGAVHQVDQADVASGNVLATVAAIYSRGAKTPISAAELAAFNPGATLALSSILRIPPLTCVASTAQTGPGNTFASLHLYYGLSYDALGYAARLVPGLYASGTALTVDSEERDTQVGTGTGNAGFELHRDALRKPCPDPKQQCPPPDPTPEQIAAFGSASMESLYTLLSAGVGKNAFFTASPQGMPTGPRTSNTADEVETLRDPVARRGLLSARAAEPLDYVQALGFGSFSAVNPSPEGDPDGPLPKKSTNPYAGVGTPIQLHLRWLDLFGNQIVSAFDAPPPAYQGPLNDLPEPIAYTDRIVGLGQWPNVRSEYLYDQYPDDVTPSTPRLTIALALETAVYDDSRPDWQKTAANDLKTFTRVYFQLNQNYDTVGVPGLSGQAVSMSLTNTLLAEPEVPLPDADAQVVRDFVARCLTYVWHRSRGESGGDPPVASVSMPVGRADLAVDDVIPVSLLFTLTRQAELTDPALRVVPGGLSDTTEVLPQTNADANDPNVSLHDFAVKAEAAFETADWQLRIGTSAAAPGAAGIDGLALWAVRMAKTPGAGLGYEIQPGASFYAPEPVATTLRDGTAKIGRYETGQKFPAGADSLTFAGVDLNAWAQQTFAAIDAFLSATYAAPAFVVDELLSDDPENEGHLAKILGYKETLAAAVARTVKPILVTSADDHDSVKAAEDKLYQALLNQLGAASTVTAVTVFKVTDAKMRRSLPDGVTPPRFYGQPTGKPPKGDGDSGKDNFALSTAKIPLDLSTGDGDSHLAFLFSSKNAAEHAYVPLELSFSMSHLEHDIVEVPEIKGYEQSQWIKFVTGPFPSPMPPPPADEDHPNAVDLPVVLRALPQPPSVTAQAATPTHPESDKPDEVARWDYGFTYLYRSAAQDALSATIEFNRGPSLRASFVHPTEKALFEKLAQFVTVQPAIARDLETYLRPIDGASKAEDQGVQYANFALAALETIVCEVATAYDAWSKRTLVAADVGPPAHLVYEFDVVLVDEEGRARVEIRSEKELPEPFVDIDPAEYEAVRQMLIPQPGSEVRFAFQYKRRGITPDEWLSYHDALGIPTRVVGYADLDVFARQDGYASIHVTRNTHILPSVETTKTFQFATPQVQFADRIVPLLARRKFNLDGIAPPKSPLETYLDDFFKALLAGAEGQEVAVKMTSGYSFKLDPSLPGLPRTVLPISLLPPAPMKPDATTPVATAVADAVNVWLKNHDRPPDGDAQLTFGLEVFAGPDVLDQKPLLTIADLHLDVDHLPAS